MVSGVHGDLRVGGGHLTAANISTQAHIPPESQKREKILSGLSHILSRASPRDTLTLRWVALRLAGLSHPDRGVEELQMHVLLPAGHLAE